jgi:hypothetical protein
MDARSILFSLLATFAFCVSADAQVFVGPRSVVQTPNFRVYASNPGLANQVAQVAEENRKKLAIHWLGSEIPNWPQPCPLTVHDGRIPASGETKYVLIPGGGVADFQMSVSGTPERIIDSVLPHEITHTIMASHFAALGKPVPRWADEGACTTVEHVSEKSKHDHMLIQFLGQGKGIPFATLFMLKDYPPEMLPLYAQGYSLTCFLISQGGPRRFIQFLERGMESDDWVAATEEYYQYPRIGKLQVAWNDWVCDGGGETAQYTADALGISNRSIAANARPANTLASRDVPSLDGGAVSEVRTAAAMVSLNSAEEAPSVLRAATNVAANSPTLNEISKSMNPSSGSYYLDQLRKNQSVSSATNAANPAGTFVPAARAATASDSRSIPHSVSQPPPFQSFGNGTIRR